MKTRLAILALVMCVASVSMASPPPLSDRLPADTKVYLGWSGRTMAFEGSLMGQLLGEPSVEKFLLAIKKTAEKTLPAEAQKKVFGHGWAMALTAWQHPTAIALTDVPLDGEGQLAGVPGAIVLIELGKDQPAFKKELDGLIDAIDEEIPVNETRIGDAPCRTIRLGRGLAICFGFDKTTFFLSTRQGVVSKVQAVEADKSLATSKEFTAAMKDVARKNLQMAMFADADWLIETFTRAMPSRGGSSPDVGKMLKAAGLSKITVIAAATSIVDRNMYTRGRVFTPAPHTGLLNVLATDPLTDEDLSDIPADADFAMAAKLPLDTLYTEADRFAKSVLNDPNAMDQTAGGIRRETGLDLKKDIIDAMGDTWVLTSAPSRGGFLTGTSLSVSLKDSRKAAATIAKIEAKIRQYARQQADRPRRSPFDSPTIPRLYTRKTPRAEITTCTFHGGLMPAVSVVAPSWTIYKDKLHLALWPQVVQSIVETNGTNAPLTADETFKTYRKYVAAKPVALTWVNTPSLLKQVYNLTMIGWSMGANQLTASTGVEFRPGWLPPLKTMQKYLKPSISALSTDANGILMEHYGPWPSTGSELLNTPAMMVSVLVPSLHSARQRAKQAVSQVRLKGLGTAIALYQNDYQGTMPPTLDVLVQLGYMGADQVRSPFADRPISWSRSKGFSREPDYVLVQGTDSAGLDGSMIMAYERPELGNKKGTNVLHIDKSVTYMSMKEFQAALKKTRAAIRDKAK